MARPKIPASAGSKLVRDFIEKLCVASRGRLKYTDVPLNKAPGTRTTVKPDVVYTSGKGARNAHGREIKYVYTTDSQGRVTSAHARPLELPAQNTRSRHYANTPGKRPGDDAGHLIADMFGGSRDLDNMVSMASDVNRKNMAALEQNWKRRMSGVPPETIDVDVKVLYGADGRPIGFRVFEIVDGRGQPVGQFIN